MKITWFRTAGVLMYGMLTMAVLELLFGVATKLGNLISMIWR